MANYVDDLKKDLAKVEEQLFAIKCQREGAPPPKHVVDSARPGLDEEPALKARQEDLIRQIKAGEARGH